MKCLDVCAGHRPRDGVFNLMNEVVVWRQESEKGGECDDSKLCGSENDVSNGRREERTAGLLIKSGPARGPSRRA